MWAEIATAAAVTVAPGSYGGGVVPTAAQSNAGQRLALVSVRVPQTASASSELYVITTADCGRQGLFEVELRTTTTFDADGAFSETDSGDFTFDNDGAHKLNTTWRIAGTFADGKLGGTLRVRATRRGKRCKTTTESAWQARNPAVGTNDAPPAPGTPYFGVTSQVVADHYPAPIVLRTSGNGQQVLGAQWLVSARCRKQRNDLFVNTTPKTTIAARAFERNERFSVRYVEGLVDFRARLAGTFTDAGVNGTLRLRETWHPRRSDKRVVDRCDSGSVTWRAAP